MLTANLSGVCVLVTGAGSGIGLATALMFARNGATVATNHLPDDAGAMSAINALADRDLPVIAVPGDVGDPTSAHAMVEEAVMRLGRLDVLVNNAGVNLTREPIPFEALDEMTEQFWSTVLSVNLVGSFRCARAAAPALKQARGSIVNVASVSAFTNRGTSIAYSASKAGIVSLTRSLSRALAPHVRVNAVAPGYVETPLTSDWSEERKTLSASRSLLGRGATADEIAEAIFGLAVGSAFVNGQTLLVDGGG